MKTELISIRKVKPNPENPRTIKDAAFKRLVKSLEDCPDLFNARPLLCSDRTGELVVLGGNMRLRAAKELKYKEVPVIIMKGLTEEQEREIAIKDNGAFGEWDYDALANDWSHLPLADWGVDIPDDFVAPSEPEDNRDAEPQIDRAEELNKVWQVQPGDLWAIGDHRLLCGDSTKAEDVARVMGGEKADCVFTSPPYAVGIDYGETYEDTIQNLRGMLACFAELWKRVIVDGGYAVTNFGDIVSGRELAGSDGPCEYPMALEYWPIFRAAGWALWSRRVWCKPNARVHSPWAIQSNRAASDWEHVWTWKLAGDAIVGRVNGEFQSANGWFDTTREHGVDIGKSEHGAGMAMALPVRMISIHSKQNAIVHEPCCGTGTTMVAAENLSRKCRGIEISPAYCAVILERMKTAFPELKIERAENGNI